MHAPADLMQLPRHVATADEPLRPLNENAGWPGTDLCRVPPVEQMLRSLHEFDVDVVSYIALWRKHFADAGLSVSLRIDSSGERYLSVGTPCDGQARHRNRYTHFLIEDLDADSGERREWLMKKLFWEGGYIDERPAEPRVTTAAIRGFLQAQGRILVNPEGHLTEGGGVPRHLINGTDEEIEANAQATRTYYAVRRRWRADAHIKRTARMLGKRTENGWIVLEKRAPAALEASSC